MRFTSAFMALGLVLVLSQPANTGTGGAATKASAASRPAKDAGHKEKKLTIADVASYMGRRAVLGHMLGQDQDGAMSIKNAPMSFTGNDGKKISGTLLVIYHLKRDAVVSITLVPSDQHNTRHFMLELKRHLENMGKTVYANDNKPKYGPEMLRVIAKGNPELARKLRETPFDSYKVITPDKAFPTFSLWASHWYKKGKETITRIEVTLPFMPEDPMGAPVKLQRKLVREMAPGKVYDLLGVPIGVDSARIISHLEQKASDFKAFLRRPLELSLSDGRKVRAIGTSYKIKKGKLCAAAFFFSDRVNSNKSLHVLREDLNGGRRPGPRGRNVLRANGKPVVATWSKAEGGMVAGEGVGVTLTNEKGMEWATLNAFTWPKKAGEKVKGPTTRTAASRPTGPEGERRRHGVVTKGHRGQIPK